MNYIILSLVFIAIIVISVYITVQILKPKIRQSQKIDESIIIENEKQYALNEELRSKHNILQSDNTALECSNQNLRYENNKLTNQKQTTIQHLNELENSVILAEKQAQEAYDLLYKNKLEALEVKYTQDVSRANAQFQCVLAEHDTLVQQSKNKADAEIASYEREVARLKAIHDAAVEVYKQTEEARTQSDFYRIQLTEEDIREIAALRSIEYQLRNKEPLNKIIWKCYYEKPTTDMIGRIVGSGTNTGIYKITEISSGKCYVGQAVNIADRWKQHIKRGVGAETPTRNKLYPAMNAAGPENFMFQVVEICDRSLLDEREQYWQEFFKAKEYGFSIK